MSKLAVHWMPGHNRNEDIELIAQLQPKSVKIIDPDPMQIHRAHLAAPHALIVLRDYRISEQHQLMHDSPAETGAAHADWWAGKITELYQRASDQRLSMPARTQFLVLGLNEPSLDAGDRSRMNYDQWLRRTLELYDHLIAYSLAFLQRCARHGLRAGLLNLAVGWPPNLEDGKPPHWAPFDQLTPLLGLGGHLFVLHEYWPAAGPAWGWGWYAGRYTQCPLQVPILIGECGIDQRIVGEGDDHKRGWQAHLQPEAYMRQLAEYDARLMSDPRIHSAQVFTTDFTGHQWQSFNTWPIHDLWRHHAATHPGGEPDGEIQPPAPKRALSIVDCLVKGAPAGGGVVDLLHANLEVEIHESQRTAGRMWHYIQIGELRGWVAETNHSSQRQLRAL